MKRRLVALVALVVACGGAQQNLSTTAAATAPGAGAASASASASAPASASAAASAAASPVPAAWPYPMKASTAPSAHGAVTSDSTIATKVGLEMLKSGGNAVDAAVATAFALAVAYPTAGNLGGGGFAVVVGNGDAKTLDFRETAPAAASRAMYAGADGKPNKESKFGWKASGVPASVAGLWALHEAKGSKPWKEVVAPAIALARDGFVVDDAFHDELADDDEQKRLSENPASAALFYPGGQAPKIGATWKNADLATVLQRIADKGAKGFYEGPTAAAIAKDEKANAGLITLEDLRSYQAKWRAPLTFTYRGKTIVAMPPPSSGGVTIEMMMNILQAYDLPKMPWHSIDELHLDVEAMRRAFAARNARLGDPDFVKNPLDELLSPAWADAQRATIKPDKATPSSEIPSVGVAAGPPHTTNLCVVDDKGNAVALTTTLNWWFGNGVTIAGTGIVMNNEMDDFASVPGTANGFGLVQGEPNAIAPKKRMLSSMSPVVVLGEDGKPALVAGGAGGPRIITAVFAILQNAIDHGLDPVAAVDAPRFHMQHLPDEIRYEKDGLTDEQRTKLAAMGYAFKEAGHLADANAIGKVPVAGPGGANQWAWIAAADPRRKGSLALGW